MIQAVKINARASVKLFLEMSIANYELMIETLREARDEASDEGEFKSVAVAERLHRLIDAFEMNVKPLEAEA